MYPIIIVVTWRKHRITTEIIKSKWFYLNLKWFVQVWEFSVKCRAKKKVERKEKNSDAEKEVDKIHKANVLYESTNQNLDQSLNWLPVDKSIKDSYKKSPIEC